MAAYKLRVKGKHFLPALFNRFSCFFDPADFRSGAGRETAFRPAGCRRTFSLLFLPFFFLSFSACGTAQVLDLPLKEAAGLLQKGDAGFILNAELPDDFFRAQSRLKELVLIHPAAPFYAGLLADAESVSREEAKNPRSGRELSIILFCAALESPSPPARREAAGRLIPLILEADKGPADKEEAENILGLLNSKNMKESPDAHLPVLRAACLYRLGRHDEIPELLSKNSEDPRENALLLFSRWKSASAASPGTKGGNVLPAEPADNEKLKNEILDFLLGPLSGGIRRWAYNEALSLEGFPGQEEIPALFTEIGPGNYGSLPDNLRSAPPEGSIIFFRFPGLIGELGEAYQYSPALREEGAELFALWDSLTENAETGHGAAENETGGENGLAAFMETLDDGELKDRRYRVLYWAGRIARAREEYAASSEYFKRALTLAPDGLQSDACIWYTLLNAYAEDPAAAVPPLLGTMPEWNDTAYFDDILDRLSSFLSAGRKWSALLEIFNGLESRGGGASLAKYAWILGRAAEEGYFTGEKSAADFFRVVLENEASFYYRAMAALKLGEGLIPESSAEIPGGTGGEASPEKTKAQAEKTTEKELNYEAEFLRGFFEYGTSSFVLPYVRAREKELPLPALREIAGALAAEARWKESLDLVSRYMSREDYKISRKDLCLFYPRPYRELIEKYAGEAELGPEILYGLVRTESYFESSVVSRSGAVGLGQLMDPTALDMAGRIARRGGPDYRDGGINLKDPETSLHIASFYLEYLTEQMGSLMPALLAYNGGMGRMRRWLADDRARGGFPEDMFLETVEFPETREYGRRVLAAAAVYGYLYYGMSMEEAAANIYPALGRPAEQTR